MKLNPFNYSIIFFVSCCLADKCFDPDFISKSGLSNYLPPPPSIFNRSLYGAKPLIIERDGWAGHYLSTAVATILLTEFMNYDISIYDTAGGDDGYLRVATSVVDANFEVWPLSESTSKYQLWVTDKGATVDAGNLGIIGQSGWYIPNYLIESPYQSDFLDFWRAYREPSITQLFTRSGAVNNTLYTGTGREFIPPWCIVKTDPPNCVVSSYDPSYTSGDCTIEYNPYCMELLAIDATYDPGILQEQIRNLHLNMTVPFLSENNFYSVVLNYMATQTPILLYYWIPTPFIAQNPLTRVSLSPPTDACYSNHTANWDGYGSVNCDFPTQSLIKIYGSRFNGNNNMYTYNDFIKFIDKFSLTTTDQINMLSSMTSTDTSTWDNDAHTISCNWLKNNVHRWTAWISNTVPPSITYTMITGDYKYGVLGLVVAFGTVSMILHGLLFIHKENPVIKSSSHLFCQIIVLGTWLAYVGLILYPYKDSNTSFNSCIGVPLCFSFAFNLFYGALCAKTYRIYKIFNFSRLKMILITDLELIIPVALGILIDSIIIITWSLIDSPQPVQKSEGLETWRECDSTHYNVFLLLLLIPKLFITIYSGFLAYNVRNVTASFNESKYLGGCLYNLLIISVFIIPSLFALPGRLVNIMYLLYLFGVSFSVFISLLMFFIPKMLMVYSPSPEFIETHKSRIKSKSVSDNKSGIDRLGINFDMITTGQIGITVVHGIMNSLKKFPGEIDKFRHALAGYTHRSSIQFVNSNELGLPSPLNNKSPLLLTVPMCGPSPSPRHSSVVTHTKTTVGVLVDKEHSVPVLEPTTVSKEKGTGTCGSSLALGQYIQSSIVGHEGQPVLGNTSNTNNNNNNSHNSSNTNNNPSEHGEHVDHSMLSHPPNNNEHNNKNNHNDSNNNTAVADPILSALLNLNEISFKVVRRNKKS